MGRCLEADDPMEPHRQNARPALAERPELHPPPRNRPAASSVRRRRLPAPRSQAPALGAESPDQVHPQNHLSSPVLFKEALTVLSVTFREEGPAHCILCDKDKKDTTDVQFGDGSFE